MAVNGSGSTTPSVGAHQYDDGTSVPVTATPASGWQFDHWKGDFPSGQGNSASFNFTMSGAKTLTVYFKQIKIELKENRPI